MQTFTVSYQLTDQDYVDFNEHFMRHTPEGKKAFWLVRLTPLFMSVVMLVIAWMDSHDPVPVVILAVVLGIFFTVWFFLSPRWVLKDVRRNLQKNRKKGLATIMPVGDITVDFENQTLLDKGENAEMKLAFSAIQKFYNGKTAFYLYFAPNQAVVMPYRTFPDMDTLLAFRQQAEAAFHH